MIGTEGVSDSQDKLRMVVKRINYWFDSIRGPREVGAYFQNQKLKDDV